MALGVKEPRFCPHCGIDLYGEAIPGFVGDKDDEQFYYRALGVEILRVCEGVLFHACPDCYGTWHRWTAQYNPNLWAAAEKYRARFTESMRTSPCSE